MKVAVAYSGGLDTSTALVWLKKVKKAEKVIAILVDVGQKEDLNALARRAQDLGADTVSILNCQDDLCDQGIAPMLKALAKYENNYLLGTAIARPFIAESVVKTALLECADTICHGATGKGNDYLRFEQRILSLQPEMKILSPWREWQFGGREEAYSYLKEAKVPIESSQFSYSQDANLWHTSFEGGELENISAPIPKELQQRMLHSGSVQVSIGWKNGVPSTLNGKELSLSQLIIQLNEILAPTGYGWIDLIETRTNGLKSRGIYYTPAGSLLYLGQSALASCIFNGPTLHWMVENSLSYAQMIYEGHWNHPLLNALNLTYESLYQGTTGEIEFLVQGAQAMIQKRNFTPNLFNQNLAGFGNMQTWNNKMSEALVYIQQLKWNSKPF